MDTSLTRRDDERHNALCMRLLYMELDGPSAPQLRCDEISGEISELSCIRWRNHFGMCSSLGRPICGIPEGNTTNWATVVCAGASVLTAQYECEEEGSEAM